MKPIFVKNEEKELEYFIFGSNIKVEESKKNEKSNDSGNSKKAEESEESKEFEDMDDSYRFKDIKSISEKAFYNPWNLRRVYFDDNLEKIKKEAFEDCSELEVFCCGEVCDNNDDKDSTIKGLKFNQKVDSFVIETKAFSGCTQLHTVVLPECDELIIEKDAFKGCKELRTVVCLCNKISFTENPFEDCLESLVFVGKKDEKQECSDLERFARENGYRYVDGK